MVAVFHHLLGSHGTVKEHMLVQGTRAKSIGVSREQFLYVFKGAWSAPGPVAADVRAAQHAVDADPKAAQDRAGGKRQTLEAVAGASCRSEALGPRQRRRASDPGDWPVRHRTAAGSACAHDQQQSRPSSRRSSLSTLFGSEPEHRCHRRGCHSGACVPGGNPSARGRRRSLAAAGASGENQSCRGALRSLVAGQPALSTTGEPRSGV